MLDKNQFVACHFKLLVIATIIINIEKNIVSSYNELKVQSL